MTPPTLTDPRPGMCVPTLDQCPECRAIRHYWVYNPFSVRARLNAGWVLWRSRWCTCQGKAVVRKAVVSRQSSVGSSDTTSRPTTDDFTTDDFTTDDRLSDDCLTPGDSHDPE